VVIFIAPEVIKKHLLLNLQTNLMFIELGHRIYFTWHISCKMRRRKNKVIKPGIEEVTKAQKKYWTNQT